jgi:hypothetical protein
MAPLRTCIARCIVEPWEALYSFRCQAAISCSSEVPLKLSENRARNQGLTTSLMPWFLAPPWTLQLDQQGIKMALGLKDGGPNFEQPKSRDATVMVAMDQLGTLLLADSIAAKVQALLSVEVRARHPCTPPLRGR